MADESWFVYIAECSDGSLYTGIAKDVHERMKVHNAGQGAKYTRSRLPCALRWFEKRANKPAALKAELWLKKLSRKDKLRIIESGIPY